MTIYNQKRDSRQNKRLQKDFQVVIQKFGRQQAADSPAEDQFKAVPTSLDQKIADTILSTAPARSRRKWPLVTVGCLFALLLTHGLCYYHVEAYREVYRTIFGSISIKNPDLDDHYYLEFKEPAPEDDREVPYRWRMLTEAEEFGSVGALDIKYTVVGEDQNHPALTAEEQSTISEDGFFTYAFTSAQTLRSCKSVYAIDEETGFYLVDRYVSQDEARSYFEQYFPYLIKAPAGFQLGGYYESDVRFMAMRGGGGTVWYDEHGFLVDFDYDLKEEAVENSTADIIDTKQKTFIQENNFELISEETFELDGYQGVIIIGNNNNQWITEDSGSTSKYDPVPRMGNGPIMHIFLDTPYYKYHLRVVQEAHWPDCLYGWDYWEPVRDGWIQAIKTMERRS